jgi:hypothetical protein
MIAYLVSFVTHCTYARLAFLVYMEDSRLKLQHCWIILRGCFAIIGVACMHIYRAISICLTSTIFNLQSRIVLSSVCHCMTSDVCVYKFYFL